MSGGTFDGNQYHIGQIADDIEHEIYHNYSTELNEWGDTIGNGYTEKTIDELKTAVKVLRLAQIYAQRADYLFAGDDGEESFHTRLIAELKYLACI